jgi:hypothetical protein
MQNRIFSTTSAKAIKAQGFGYLNAIHYMAPASLSGVNLCPHSSAGCRALCLGWESGQAGMVSHDAQINSVRASRIEKAQRFMKDRAAYLLDVVRSIDNTLAEADRKGLKPCFRMNGATDIAWEGVRFSVWRNMDGKAQGVVLGGAQNINIFDHYPDVDFVDYTKNPKRFDRALPANYHLTFSRSETNEADVLQLLARGVNVAAVFAVKPEGYYGLYRVVDGDEHDLRQLDPKGDSVRGGYIIALSPKGRKAKRDTSGFVVR